MRQLREFCFVLGFLLAGMLGSALVLAHRNPELTLDWHAVRWASALTGALLALAAFGGRLRPK